MRRPLTTQPEGAKRSPVRADPESLWLVVGATGLAIAIIGWVDLALLWYPLNFGSPDWEFGTVTAHLDGMPLGTVGLTLVIAATIAREWYGGLRVLAGCCLVVTLLLLVVAGIYLLSLPLALEAMRQQAVATGLGKAVVKAGVFATTYITLYAWMTWYLWKSARART